jgi:hypothetical protein
MNKKIVSFAFLGLMLGSFTQTKCLTFKKAAVITSAVVAGLALYRLYDKKAEVTPLSRFESEKLKTAISNGEFTEAANQLWYFIDDTIIGQMYKKDSLKWNAASNALEINKGTPSAGLLGTLQGKLFPLGMALFFVVEVKDFMDKLRKTGDVVCDYIA